MSSGPLVIHVAYTVEERRTAQVPHIRRSAGSATAPHRYNWAEAAAKWTINYFLPLTAAVGRRLDARTHAHATCNRMDEEER
jgi:hypothetical protein